MKQELPLSDGYLNRYEASGELRVSYMPFFEQDEMVQNTTELD